MVPDGSGGWEWRMGVPDRSARLKSVLGYEALRAGRWRHGAGRGCPMEVPDGSGRWEWRTEVADGSGGQEWPMEVPDRSARLKSVLGYKALRAGRWRHGAGQEWPMEVADGSAGRECPMGVPDGSGRRECRTEVPD
jgi:hypothetical protein